MYFSIGVALNIHILRVNDVMHLFETDPHVRLLGRKENLSSDCQQFHQYQ